MPGAQQHDRQGATWRDPDKSKTLDDFFTKRGSPLTLEQSTSALRNKNKLQLRRKSTLNEVIVIDSDDEPEVLVTRTSGKRRLSEDSDIEIIDTIPYAAKRPSVQKVPVEGRSPHNSISNSTPNESSPTFVFGQPTLLFPKNPEPQSSPSIKFGSPGSLLRSDRQPEAAAASLSFTQSSPPLQDQTLDSEVDITGETMHVQVHSTDNAAEEWLTGDDEMGEGHEKEDEGEEVEFVEDTLLRAVSLENHTLDLCDSASQNLNYSCLAEAKAPISLVFDLDKSKNKIPQPEVNPNASSFTESCAKSSAEGNAFFVLMSSFKEKEAWKEAAVAEDKAFKPVKANGGRRKAPFYKVLQGMPIAVDAFRYGSIPGITAYFLSHAHSDHYTNLSSSWKNGPIYCSESTANLIIHMLSVDRKWVHPLPMNVPTLIPNTGSVQVTLIDANHCPGSCLFLFEGPQTVNAGDSTYLSPFVGSSGVFRYLHCGDFRASPRHVMHPAVRGKKIDHVYLDTTYLDPKYSFPPQPLVISACAELSRRLAAGEPTTTNETMKSWLNSTVGPGKKSKVLILVGTYSIGKERIVKAIAHALNSKVYCDSRKTAILRCQADSELEALLTSDPLEATVHLVPLGAIATDRLKIYMDRYKGAFNKVIGFRPTGWTYSPPAGSDQVINIASILSRASHKDFTHVNLQPLPRSSASVQVFPVPYSEHSSFYELTCFAMSLNWTRIIATVNVGSERSRGKMAKWVERWEAERKKRDVSSAVTPRHEDYW